MLVQKYRALPRTKIIGSGTALQTGEGLISDGFKAVGRHALFGLKSLWNNVIRPRAAIGATEAIKMGREVLKTQGPELAKIVHDAIASKLAGNKLDSEVNRALKLADSTKDLITERSKEILNRLMIGKGLRRLCD